MLTKANETGSEFFKKDSDLVLITGEDVLVPCAVDKIFQT